jgi:hypothetical protein
MLNFTRRLQMTLSDDLRLWYWRQVFHATRWLRKQEPRLVYLRRYYWLPPLAGLMGVLLGLMMRLSV